MYEIDHKFRDLAGICIDSDVHMKSPRTKEQIERTLKFEHKREDHRSSSLCFSRLKQNYKINSHFKMIKHDYKIKIFTCGGGPSLYTFPFYHIASLAYSVTTSSLHFNLEK